MPIMNEMNTNISWNGPSAGPTILSNKNITVLAVDMHNAGVAGISLGIEEACEFAGWRANIIDADGDTEKLKELCENLHTLEGDAFVINGANSFESQDSIAERLKANRPLMGWHCSDNNGPDESQGIFTNITTDASHVAELTAMEALDHLDKHAPNNAPGLIILNDSSSQFALHKAHNIASTLRSKGHEPLEIMDLPMAAVTLKTIETTQALWGKYGTQWNCTIAINDIYFDFLEAAFVAAGIEETQYPISISGGDGSKEAFERIQNDTHQKVTIAEPLLLQGWQIVDEINRALSGESWSGFCTESCAITNNNIVTNVSIDEFYDPANKYRDHYLQYWKPKQ